MIRQEFRDPKEARAMMATKRGELKKVNQKISRLLDQIAVIEGAPVTSYPLFDVPLNRPVLKSEALSQEIAGLERKASDLDERQISAEGYLDTEDAAVISDR